MSSLGYLKHLPVEYIKIDGGFIKDMLKDAVSKDMVAAINDIGHSMGRPTIAEYVENEAMLRALTTMGVDFVQGFHVGRPALWAQNVEFLAMTQEEMLDPTFQRVRDLKDIASYSAWLSTRRKAMHWLSLHAHYDDAHPWEALEIVARLLGNAPGVDEVHAVKRSIEMSYAYFKVGLDCCL